MLIQSIVSYSQIYYYYYKGEKNVLTLNKNKISLFFEDEFSKDLIENKIGIELNVLSESTTGIERKYAEINVENRFSSDLEYLNFIQILNQTEGIVKAQPNFYTLYGQNVGMSNYFYVSLKKEEDINELYSFARNNNVEVIGEIPYIPLCYTLICKKETKLTTLEIANSFFESNKFKYSIPDFLSDDIQCSSEPMFANLWGLKNNNTNIDINVCEAWNLTQGNGITVAVLDNGIDNSHLDLADNLLVLSYDSETNTSPTQYLNSNSHGTHVAGTIAAVGDNNLQITGVAPKAKLLEISNSLSPTPNSRIKRGAGINWAWQNGADIINNSWHSSVFYDEITDAIQNALTLGRNGKGTVVIFATGNSSSNTVSYPANSNNKIISVGAIDYNGARANFSNHGISLDIVAPGTNILSTVNNNLLNYYNGTSMAAPHVSGVAALILSVNPDLTVKQVADIIEQTAQKVGNYNYSNHSNRPNGTWNNEMGYGLVNAYAAVLKAQEMSKTDLYVKDNHQDTGAEPNTTVQEFWESVDIWVRNNNDGGTAHQNPLYKANGQPNFIKIRVRNRGGQTSTGYEKWAV